MQFLVINLRPSFRCHSLHCVCFRLPLFLPPGVRGAPSAEGVNVTKWEHPSLAWTTKTGRLATQHQRQQKGTRFCLHLTDAAHSLTFTPLLNLSSFYIWFLSSLLLKWEDLLHFSILPFSLRQQTGICVPACRCSVCVFIAQKSKACL